MDSWLVLLSSWSCAYNLTSFQQTRRSPPWSSRNPLNRSVVPPFQTQWRNVRRSLIHLPMSSLQQASFSPILSNSRCLLSFFVSGASTSVFGDSIQYGLSLLSIHRMMIRLLRRQPSSVTTLPNISFWDVVARVPLSPRLSIQSCHSFLPMWNPVVLPLIRSIAKTASPIWQRNCRFRMRFPSLSYIKSNVLFPLCISPSNSPFPFSVHWTRSKISSAIPTTLRCEWSIGLIYRTMFWIWSFDS